VFENGGSKLESESGGNLGPKVEVAHDFDSRFGGVRAEATDSGHR